MFPVTDIALALAKTPLIGTSPSKLLYERFRCFKGICCRYVKMCPEKLLFDKSTYSRPFNEPNDSGNDP
ncbi:hypothetical protein HanHA89_Chr14g0591741 [Helianthus annuus]|nr:hypothetical protein HanHA89_Chr14g0591741 [Helianthus annuus]